MITAAKPFRILHIIVQVTETNGQYNEHCLPVVDDRQISICTYFRNQVNRTPPRSIRVFEGDNTLQGFFCVVRKALSFRQDVVHVHAPATGALFLLANLFRPQVMAKSVYTVQNSYLSYKLRNRLLLFAIFLGYGRIVMCSQACYESLPWLLRRLARGKTNVVANSIDLERIDRLRVARTPAVGHRRFQVAVVGRLIGIKNPFVVLNAFHAAANQQSELVFIGDGNLRPQLMEAARRLGRKDQVAFTGLVPRDDVFRHVWAADLFVSASRGEGLPVAVLEAMGCGLPAVLSDIPPHREIATGVDFIPLIAPDHTEAFAREIQRYQQMSSAERSAIGAKCRQLVEERFGVGAMLGDYERIYSRVLQSANAG